MQRRKVPKNPFGLESPKYEATVKAMRQPHFKPFWALVKSSSILSQKVTALTIRIKPFDDFSSIFMCFIKTNCCVDGLKRKNNQYRLVASSTKRFKTVVTKCNSQHHFRIDINQNEARESKILNLTLIFQ